MSLLQRASWSCLLLALVFSGAPAQERKQPPAPVMSIGMAKGFFNDIPAALVHFVKPSFAALMKDFTGLNGQLVVGGDYQQLSKDLRDKKLQLAVYHGFEYAWARQIDPELQPLMIAINHYHHAHAQMVVRADCDLQSFADLKGKDVAFPYRSKEHCRLFLEKQAFLCGASDPKNYFQKIVRSENTFKALDEVLAGRLPAAVVDFNSLATYADINPGRHAKLKIAVKSEKFPPAVIVYRRGELDEATLKKFRSGMMTANKNEQGREIMNMYSVTAFESVPDDFEQNLVDIMKAYPPPVPSAPK